MAASMFFPILEPKKDIISLVYILNTYVLAYDTITSNPDHILETVTALKNISVEDESGITMMVQLGVIPIFSKLLECEISGVKLEVLKVLSNIAAADLESNGLAIMRDPLILPTIIELLDSPVAEIRRVVVITFSNTALNAGYPGECRDRLIHMGVVSKVLNLLDKVDEDITVVEVAARCIASLSGGKPMPSFDHLREVIPSCIRHIRHPASEAVLAECLETIGLLSNGLDERIDIIINAGISPRVVELMGHHNETIQRHAQIIVGNILTGNEAQADVVLHAGAIAQLGKLLIHDNKRIRKEACWSVSNIAAGTVDQVQALLQFGLFPTLINLMEADDTSIRKEAMHSIYNITSRGNTHHIKSLVEFGVIRGLIQFFTVDNLKLVTLALQSLQNILTVGQVEALEGLNAMTVIFESCGGLDKLVQLQLHVNLEVYELSSRILARFFVEEEGEMVMDDEMIGGLNLNE